MSSCNNNKPVKRKKEYKDTNDTNNTYQNNNNIANANSANNTYINIINNCNSRLIQLCLIEILTSDNVELRQSIVRDIKNGLLLINKSIIPIATIIKKHNDNLLQYVDQAIGCEILTFLDAISIINSHRINKSFNSASKKFAAWKYAEVKISKLRLLAINDKIVHNNVITNCSLLRNTQVFRLDIYQLNANDVNCIQSFLIRQIPHLRILKLYQVWPHSELTIPGLAKVTQLNASQGNQVLFPKLIQFSINFTTAQVFDSSVPYIGNIRALYLHQNNFNHFRFYELCKLGCLDTLCIPNSSTLNELNLELITKHLINLRQLNIHNCPLISPVGYKHLNNLKKLSILTIGFIGPSHPDDTARYTQILNDTIYNISTLTDCNISELNISNQFTSFVVEDAFWGSIHKLRYIKSLRRLAVYGTITLNHGIINSFSQLTQINELVLPDHLLDKGYDKIVKMCYVILTLSQHNLKRFGSSLWLQRELKRRNCNVDYYPPSSVSTKLD